jgi:hypothetical protein
LGPRARQWIQSARLNDPVLLPFSTVRSGGLAVSPPANRRRRLIALAKNSPAAAGQLPSGHKVLCLWPHSLQAYSTRPWPCSAVMRLGAPHLVHFTSSRVLPRVIVTSRAIASLTKRSDSRRMASFDISGARGFLTINPRFPTSQSVAYFCTAPNWADPGASLLQTCRRSKASWCRCSL